MAKSFLDIQKEIQTKTGLHFQNWNQEADNRLKYTPDEKKVLALPTASITLNWATRIGGFPRGGVTEIYGPQSVGKGTLLLETCRDAIDNGENVVYLDHEWAFDPVYAKDLGLDMNPEHFMLYQPECLEDGMNIAEHIINKAPNVGLVVFDSVDAMVPRAMAEAEIGDELPAIQSRKMGQALKQLKAKIGKAKAAWVFINQIRSIIDMSWKPAGQKAAAPLTTTSGGKALKFYADMRIDLMPGRQDATELETIMMGHAVRDVTGFYVTARVEKNKRGVPSKVCEYYLRKGKGVDNIISLLDIGSRANLFEVSAPKTPKSTTYKLVTPYCRQDMQSDTVVGRDNAVEYLQKYPEALNALEKAIRSILDQME